MVRVQPRRPGEPHLLVARIRLQSRRSLRRAGRHGRGPQGRGGRALPVGVLRPHREGVGGVVDQTCHRVLGFVGATVRAAVRDVRPGRRGRVRVRGVFVAGHGAAAVAGRRRPGERRLGVSRCHAQAGRGRGQAGSDGDGVGGGARVVRVVAIVVVHRADLERVGGAVGQGPDRMAGGAGVAAGDVGPGRGVLLDLVLGDAGVVRVVPGERRLGIPRRSREARGLGRGAALRGRGHRRGGGAGAYGVLRKDREGVGSARW